MALAVASESGVSYNHGYIVNDLKEKPEKKIHINEFLNNNDLISRYHKEDIYIVSSDGIRLQKYHSIKHKSYFRKYNADNKTGEMSEWHKQWQADIVEETGAASEVSFPKKANSYCDREADIYFEEHKVAFQLIEVQNSRIKKQEIEQRKHDYGLYGLKIYWILNCNSCELKRKKNGTYFITFNRSWLYESFKGYDGVFGNIKDEEFGNIVFKFNPHDVRSQTIIIDCICGRNLFINNIKEDKDTWEDYVSYKPLMIVHEKGAGTGKTFKAIQNLFEFSDIDKYDTFLVVTKCRSARDVIVHELNDQKKRGKLDSFKITNYNEPEDRAGRYIIKFDNKDGVEKRIIMSTIDSLSYNIRKPPKNKRYREAYGENGEILKDIINGGDNLTEAGGFTFAGEYVKLNSQTLLMIDEAQDLPPIYLKAFMELIKKTHLNSYIVGNKLQSIYHFPNMISILFDKNEKRGDWINIKKHKDPNICRRFHNIWHMRFVNHFVDFKKYGLSEITDICPHNDDSCGYIHSDKKEDALEFFQIEKILPNEKDEEKISKTIKSVICIMEKECISHCRLPNDFSIIVPIVTKNALLDPIQAELNNWWEEKLNDEDYKKRLMKERKEDYEEFIKHNKYGKCFELHYSDNGRKPITLKDSDYQVRCYTIHSSKGDGRPVVIALGITEKSLLTHSIEHNTKYDSLEHVSITRMKIKIYFGYVANNDTIHKKINTFCKKHNYIKNLDDTIEPDILYKHSEKLTRITKICDAYSDNYQNIDKAIIGKKSYAFDIEKFKKKNKKDVDWGDHCIRRAVCKVHELIWVYNKNTGTKKNKKSQIATILRKIRQITIMECPDSLYNKILWNYDFRKINGDLKYIPIRKYYRTLKINRFIKQTMKNIQSKLSKIQNDEKLAHFCVIESLILWHMLDIYLNKGYADFGYTKLHNTIAIYEKGCNSKTHQDNCICAKFINFDDDADKHKIILHYDRINTLDKLLEKFEANYNEKYPNHEMLWNINQPVVLEGNTNFKLYKQFDHFITTDEHIISLIIKPQITMDINDVIFETVLDNYLILNSEQDNNVYKKIKNKKFMSVFISLDLGEPKFIEWDDSIKNNTTLVVDVIKEALFKYFKQNHQNIYNFYKFCKKEKEEMQNKLKSVDYTIEKLRKTKYVSLPPYILEYFINLKGELKRQKNKRKWVKENIENEKKFIEGLNAELIESINSYLKISDDNSDDEDY